MSSENTGSFISFFPISMPFISFSCLIVWSRTSSTMLIWVMRVDNLALFMVLGESIQSSPLSMMLAVDFLYMPLIRLRIFLSILNLLRVFFISLAYMLNLLIYVFSSYWNNCMVFLFSLLKWWITLTDFSINQSGFHSWDKPHLSMLHYYSVLSCLRVAPHLLLPIFSCLTPVFIIWYLPVSFQKRSTN